MSDITPKQTPPAPAAEGPAERRPYEPPTLVDYGDIATLTQTAGFTTQDQGVKKRRR
jgi:hypothetical protein